jgi:hypothetical protein
MKRKNALRKQEHNFRGKKEIFAQRVIKAHHTKQVSGGKEGECKKKNKKPALKTAQDSDLKKKEDVQNDRCCKILRPKLKIVELVLPQALGTCPPLSHVAASHDICRDAESLPRPKVNISFSEELWVG